MRISKGGSSGGGNQGMTQCVGAILGGVVIHATGTRGAVTRIFISGSEMDQITAAIADYDEVSKARLARIKSEDGGCVDCGRPLTNHDLNEQQMLCVPCRCG